MSEIVDCLAFVIRKTCWSFYVFLKFLFLRLLDLFGLIFNLIACCTIWRLPFMIADFRNMEKFWQWRLCGFLQCLVFIMDIPIAIMGVIVILTFWRLYSCCKEMKSEWSGMETDPIHFTGFKIRGVVIKHFFILFIDVFCVPSAIICLLSWRSVIFIRKMRKADNDDWKRRKICFKQFALVLCDIPLLICFIIVLFSWRLPFVARKISQDITKKRKWNTIIRYRGLEHAYYLFMDIPCILAFLFTLVTWRAPILIWQLRVSTDESIFHTSRQFDIRIIVMLQFFYVFLDVPCIICALFVTVTIWRLPTLTRRIKQALSKHNEYARHFKKKEFKIRKICIVEFGMLFVDLFCFIMLMLVLATLWRAYPVIRDIKGYWKKYSDGKKISKMKDTELGQRVQSYGACSDIESEDVKKDDVNSVVDPDGDSSDIVIEEGVTVDSGNDDELQVNVEVPETSTQPSEEKQEETKILTWSKFIWKIRKTIAMHFVLFFIDLPAIPLSLLLLVTILRTSQLLSALIGSGNFYLEFAITVYYQTFRLFVDLFFLLLFFVLMLLRPIQSWIQLLEDEEHKKYRELCELLVWVPDIAHDRKASYARLEDIIPMNFKQNVSISHTRIDLNNEFDSHLCRIKDILQRLNDREIEDEVIYLLECVLFSEEKRVGKLMRGFTIELNYMQRTDSNLRKDNLFRWNKELRDFEKTVSDQYEALISYKPDKVPLYETKTGISLRTRKETRNVLISCLPKGRFVVILGIFLCCLPLYRAPTMIKRLFQRWYNKFNIVRSTLKEYALDIITIGRMLLVLMFVYRAPFMIADVLDCIVEKRSWKAVRSAVKKYPPAILEDLLDLLTVIFSWKSIRFIVSSILFGLLMPADMFLTIARLCIQSNCLAYLMTIIIYLVLMVSPVIISYYAAEELLAYGVGWITIVLLCAFSALLLVMLLFMVLALTKSKNKTFLLQMPECDYVRFSWYNIHVIIFEILEFLQMMALIFKVQSLPMYGYDVLHTTSNYLLFSFMPFKVIFWITFVFFTVWFFLCGAPIIFENILESLPIGSCGKRTSWRLALSLFANTLFVTMVENLISFSACKYQSCPSNYTLGQIPSNSSCLVSEFLEDNTLKCWTGSHRGYALFGLLGLVWYCTTSLIFGTKYGDPESSSQDIGFSPIYNTVLNILKAVMIIAVTIITNSNYTVLGILLACNGVSIMYTVGFHTLYKYYPSNLPSILVWRVFTFVACAIASIAAIVALILDDNSSKVPLLILGIGIIVTFIIAFIIAVKLRQISTVVRDREEFRSEICQLEARLEKNKWLLNCWHGDRKMWYRLIKSVRQARKDDKKFNSDDWLLKCEGTTSTATSDAITPPPMYTGAVVGLLPSDINTEVSPSVDLHYSAVPISDEPQVVSNHDSVSVTELSNDLPHSSTPISEESQMGSSDDSFSLTEFNNKGLPAVPSYEEASKSMTVQPPINQEIESSVINVETLEKNGRNLLLILERNIHYQSYRYSFLSQRNNWLNAVWSSNWTGLLHCLQILNSSLQGSYDRPTPLDISLSAPSLPTDRLEDDPQDALAPPQMFQKQTKEMIAQNSGECRQNALNDFAQYAQHGEQWRQLFDKLLPTGPVIKSWTYETDVSFELICRHPSTGTIVDIDENGNKLAKGARFTIGKTLAGRLSDFGLTFNKGMEPTAKKGPVKVTLKSLSFLLKNNTLYLEAEGKKVKFDVAMASCKTVKWS